MRKQFVLSLAVGSLALPAYADDAYIRKVYDQLTSLVKNKNVAGLKKLWAQTTTSTTTYTAQGQTIKGSQMMAQMEAQFAVVHKVRKNSYKVQSVKEKGNEKVYTVSQNMVFEIKTPDKKTAVVESSASSQDTWEKTKSGWKLKNIKILKETATMDGKPISMGG